MDDLKWKIIIIIQKWNTKESRAIEITANINIILDIYLLMLL